VDKLPASLRREQGEDGELDQDDTAVVVFPPAEGSKAVVRVLMMGEGTGSCPSGQCELAR
jgi:RAB protein geranylgeranyltransferase component A